MSKIKIETNLTLSRLQDAVMSVSSCLFVEKISNTIYHINNIDSKTLTHKLCRTLRFVSGGQPITITTL